MAKASKQTHVVSISCCVFTTDIKTSCVIDFTCKLRVCDVCVVLQGDYRQLVHELDMYQYSELRLVVLEIRNTYVRDTHFVVPYTVF